MSTYISVVSNGTTTNFKSFDESGPRYFLDLIESGPDYDIKRRRAPGWNGNALIRGGFVGHQLALIVRYQDTLANATAAWKADKYRWAQYNASITDGVTVWSRCTMRSSERTSEEMAQGATGIKFFSVRYVFDVEELY